MEYTLEIDEILSYKVTATCAVQDGKEFIHHYNIRTQEGEVVSQNYNSLSEPVRLLRELEEYVTRQRVVNQAA